MSAINNAGLVVVGIIAGILYLKGKDAQGTTNNNPPPSPGQSIIFDSFQDNDYSLADGSISPNGLWQCVYKSHGFAGVQNKEFVLEPESAAFYASLGSADRATTRSVNVQLTQKFVNLRSQFTMRTDKQLRSKAAPNAWETAWAFGKYVDKLHHYYFVIKSNNSYELGKKDNVPGDNSPEKQIFLITRPLPASLTWALGRSYNVDFSVFADMITITVNGQQLVSFKDDGSTGKQPQTAALGGQPGAFGMYCEDARAIFDNVVVTQL